MGVVGVNVSKTGDVDDDWTNKRQNVEKKR